MIGDVTNSDGSTKVSLSCHAKVRSWKSYTLIQTPPMDLRKSSSVMGTSCWMTNQWHSSTIWEMRRQQLTSPIAARRRTRRPSPEPAHPTWRHARNLSRQRWQMWCTRRRLQQWTVKQVLYRYTHHATSSNSETCDSSTSIKHEFPKMPCTTFMRSHMTSPASSGR